MVSIRSIKPLFLVKNDLITLSNDLLYSTLKGVFAFNLAKRIFKVSVGKSKTKVEAVSGSTIISLYISLYKGAASTSSFIQRLSNLAANSLS